MTLPTSGQISMSQVRLERALSGTVSLGQTEIRTLFGIASGQIALSNGYGKTYCACNCNYACTCNCNYACTCVCNYCTCNCNYCTCNCNYACTCVCNYACTCNCNYVCTCQCNYACTCNCNYSAGCPSDSLCCAAPDVPVLMADGTEKPAGEIVVGDIIRAWDEVKQEYVDAPVIVAQPATNHRMRITFSTGAKGLFARNHKFLNDGVWTELQNLKPGDLLSNGVFVAEIEDDGPGAVVLITIEDVHTYVTHGVISHNARKL